MAEFTKRGLHIEYQEFIKSWFIYLDQQRFGKELEAKMFAEIDRFMATKESIEDLIKRTFGKTEWEIEFLDQVPANYVFKSALGYT